MRRVLNATSCAWLPTAVAAVCGDATATSSSAVTRLHRFQGQNNSGRYVPKEPFTVGRKSKRAMLAKREYTPSVFATCIVGITVAMTVYFAVKASVNHIGKPPSQSELFYRQRYSAQNRSNLDFSKVDLKFDPKKDG